MELIAVLGWVDGFGADTVVYGIFDTVESARAAVPQKFGDDTEPRYVSISLNKPAEDLDWYEATPLFPRKKRKKRR